MIRVDDIVCSTVGSNMADQRSASGSMTGDRHTATATQLPTAAAGVSVASYPGLEY